MQRTIICIVGFASLACGQGVPGGTINGRPIPEGMLHSCGGIREAIRQEARSQAVKDMGITVTQEDLAAAKKAIKMSDPVADAKFMVEQETMMVNALLAVDKGQDPQQVYATMLQPKGVLPAIWESYQRQWKDPRGHKTIEARLRATPEVMARSQAAFNYEPFARNQKLDNLVDQQLATLDPAFRTALEHWNAPRPNGGHGLPASEKQYLDQQREMYWKGQEAKLNVVLNDPTLAQRCGLTSHVQ